MQCYVMARSGYRAISLPTDRVMTADKKPQGYMAGLPEVARRWLPSSHVGRDLLKDQKSSDHSCSFVRVPSLRSRSVGPRRTDIHVLTALSPHPCGSAHCARPAFSLHPSRDWR